MAEQIPRNMLPTSNSHCKVCVWERDPNKPTPTRIEVSAQQRVVVECTKAILGLSADESIITAGDSNKANHRLDMIGWCAEMMAAGLCEDIEAEAINGSPVFTAKDSPAVERPKLKSV
jgi:hypothetical protein